MKYAKRPVVVEAAQYTGPGSHPAIEYGFSTGKPAAIVKGKQGWVIVNPGDWIIAELDGSGHYPCDPDVFEATYSEVRETGTPAAVEVTVTVTAPAGKRAEVCHVAGDKKTMFAVTPGQSQTWSVMRGEWVGVAASDTSTVAHKRDAS